MNYTSFPQINPSHSELIIMDKLDMCCVFYDREVSFDGLVNPITGLPLRYDFYIPEFNMIIEYDGIEFHSAEAVKARDAIKDNFAKDNGIKLFRISGLGNIYSFFSSKYWKKRIKKLPVHENKHKQKRIHIQGVKKGKSQLEIKKALSNRFPTASIDKFPPNCSIEIGSNKIVILEKYKAPKEKFEIKYRRGMHAK